MDKRYLLKDVDIIEIHSTSAISTLSPFPSLSRLDPPFPKYLSSTGSHPLCYRFLPLNLLNFLNLLERLQLNLVVSSFFFFFCSVGGKKMDFLINRLIIIYIKSVVFLRGGGDKKNYKFV